MIAFRSEAWPQRWQRLPSFSGYHLLPLSIMHFDSAQCHCMSIWESNGRRWVYMNADTKMKKERTSSSRSEVIAFVKQSKQPGTFLHTLISWPFPFRSGLATSWVHPNGPSSR